MLCLYRRLATSLLTSLGRLRGARGRAGGLSRLGDLDLLPDTKLIGAKVIVLP